MTENHKASGTSDSDRQSQPDLDRLALTVTDRLAPHLQAAEAAVREAERTLAQAREALANAEDEAADRGYHSDPRVFMRATVAEDLEGLARKTTAKKVQASFRYLLARATELAESEVTGFRTDMAAARQERQGGVAACQRHVEVAETELAAAQEMWQRVLEVERIAGQGLQILREKMLADPT